MVRAVMETESSQDRAIATLEQERALVVRRMLNHAEAIENLCGQLRHALEAMLHAGISVVVTLAQVGRLLESECYCIRMLLERGATGRPIYGRQLGSIMGRLVVIAIQMSCYPKGRELVVDVIGEILTVSILEKDINRKLDELDLVRARLWEIHIRAESGIATSIWSERKTRPDLWDVKQSQYFELAQRRRARHRDGGDTRPVGS
jgi:hypothetical protein